MKIIYKKSIYQQIVEARYKAEHEGKEIEKIILTPTEIIMARREMSYPGDHGTIQTIMGIPIEVGL